MSLLDATYGEFPGMSSARWVAGVGGPAVGLNPAGMPTTALDPTTTSAPSSPAKQPTKPVVGEPGAGRSVGLSPATLLENPATWLVLSIAGAVALARYAATGHVL